MPLSYESHINRDNLLHELGMFHQRGIILLTFLFQVTYSRLDLVIDFGM